MSLWTWLRDSFTVETSSLAFVAHVSDLTLATGGMCGSSGGTLGGSADGPRGSAGDTRDVTLPDRLLRELLLSLRPRSDVSVLVRDRKSDEATLWLRLADGVASGPRGKDGLWVRKAKCMSTLQVPI